MQALLTRNASRPAAPPYLKARALRHKKTADSNAHRTLYWTVVEVSVLAVVAAVQVLTVRHFFNKVGLYKCTS
jgi:hypothetical protein